MLSWIVSLHYRLGGVESIHRFVPQTEIEHLRLKAFSEVVW